jgi:26S proteasome regulatory subunit T6
VSLNHLLLLLLLPTPPASFKCLPSTDKKLTLASPHSSIEARADILRIHSRSMNLTRGINLTKIAEKMNGCSGAELKGVCTEAGMYALRERRVHVTQEDFDLATAKVLNKHDDKEVSLGKLWK